ncbi:Similar to S.cerevisiae protein YCL012C (Putative protein of unknown function) [Malassezia sympodialis ATCC 42132]|uniref:Uncharacterized protein n=1 Tax=Malassezia sympodialis (strain ATCC 42132) TaxID=1230383 RepID=A0A1M8AAF3_MALS4|nr:Similar to S.cerevisiae protein YCL012C (Putative protein of unknown function) [Malassezia sympodialis ATCC 42132]
MYLYSLGSSLLLLVLILICYWQRGRIAAHLSEPTRQRLESLLQRFLPSRYSRLGVFDWNTAVNAGLTSSLFDIESNIQDGDPRVGLDEAGMEQIHRIMHTQGLTFDQARLQRHHALLRDHNIDPQTGIPLDSKAITHL